MDEQDAELFERLRQAARKRVKISKSQYMKGLQCHKALWLYRRRPDLATPAPEARQQLFDSGNEVGTLAQQYFAGGVEITDQYYETDKAVESTGRLIDEGIKTIYEATAIAGSGGYCRIDILNKPKRARKWDLIEVKQSTQVKDYHINDMAFQRYVFKNAGYEIRDSILMHLNNEYVRQGEIDLGKLFVLENCTKQVSEKIWETAIQLAALTKMVRTRTEPIKSIGPHCSSPFECEYCDYCWQHVPENSVHNFFSGKKLEALLAHNILCIEDIPDDYACTNREAILLNAHKKNMLTIDRSAVGGFISTLQYPLYFLDYETIFPAIPLFDNSSPYQQIPFQFSLHLQKTPGGSVTHIEYLHTESSDPREEFTKALIAACGNKGSVLVYNQGFESRINRELGVLFPRYKKNLDKITARMVDLLSPFRSRAVYHPAMNGSASLKNVLPALVPELNYENLEIGDGGAASRMYLQSLSGMASKEEKNKIFENLREYCCMDTWAEVKLTEFLYQNT